MKKEEQLSRQLEMNFSGRSKGNLFREHLANAEFSVLLELHIPGRDSKLESVVSKYSELESVAMSPRNFPGGLAFLDDSPDFPSLDPGEFAAALCKTGRDRHLIYLNGRDRTQEDIDYNLGIYRFEGFKNIVAVSGAAGSTLEDAVKHRYYDSSNILQRNACSKEPLFAGCVANPFKYTRTDSILQYSKLNKKIAAGAQFVVAQSGWDMRKLLEMRWCMFRRSQNIPTLARILYLSPEKAEDICSGKCPGLWISDDLKRAIRKEMMYSLAQFEAAQWRRLQIHAAGAKFLGYSGIQIAGVDDPETANRIYLRIQEAMSEFSNYDDWRAAHNDYYSKVEMAPYPYRYYLFENMLAEGVTCDTAKVNSEPLPECSFAERFRYRLARFLLPHADRMPAEDKRLTKRLLAACHRNCDSCHLPQTMYVCTGNCPKLLNNGVCGESRPSGDCPYTDTECIFAALLRRAELDNDYSVLDENIIR